MATQIDLEYRAISSLLKLFEDAKACRILFVDAGLPLPPSLVRLFDLPTAEPGTTPPKDTP